MDYVINTTTDKVNSIGGMALVGKILKKICFCKNSERIPKATKRVSAVPIKSLTAIIPFSRISDRKNTC